MCFSLAIWRVACVSRLATVSLASVASLARRFALALRGGRFVRLIVGMCDMYDD